MRVLSKVAVAGLESASGWGCKLSNQLEFIQIWFEFDFQFMLVQNSPKMQAKDVYAAQLCLKSSSGDL